MSRRIPHQIYLDGRELFKNHKSYPSQCAQIEVSRHWFTDNVVCTNDRPEFIHRFLNNPQQTVFIATIFPRANESWDYYTSFAILAWDEEKQTWFALGYHIKEES